MVDSLPRERTPAEIRSLKELGAFDVGTTYIRVGGFSKEPKHKRWDEDDKQPDS